MREFSVCRPPEYHQLHDNLNAMATESRGPLHRSHGGPHSQFIVSHHIQKHVQTHFPYIIYSTDAVHTTTQYITDTISDAYGKMF